MKRNKIPFGSILIVAGMIFVVWLISTNQATIPTIAQPLPDQADACNKLVAMMTPEGKAVAGDITATQGFCCVMEDGAIDGCSANKTYSGIITIADITNTGKVDFTAEIGGIVVTPVQKVDDETARVIRQSFEQDAHIVAMDFVTDSGAVKRLSTAGAYPSSGASQLIPAGGQGLWYSYINLGGSPNVGLVPGKVVIDYRVCATKKDYKSVCVSQKSMVLNIMDNGGVAIEQWEGN